MSKDVKDEKMAGFSENKALRPGKKNRQEIDRKRDRHLNIEAKAPIDLVVWNASRKAPSARNAPKSWKKEEKKKKKRGEKIRINPVERKKRGARGIRRGRGKHKSDVFRERA